MRTYLTITLIIFFISLCNLHLKGQVINGSFEDDFGNFSLEGWQNNGGTASNIASPYGGVWSLGLYGGCIWVNCSQKIPQIQPGEIWMLTCWAKTEDMWGGGNISWSNGYNGVFVSDSTWSQYTVVDTFDIANFDTISIVIEGGGGFAGGGGILVDMVEIESLGSIITSVSDIDEPQGETQLFQNVPNPFSTQTIISFEIDFPATVSLTIYDLLGQAVHVFVNDYNASGQYEYVWSPRGDRQSGIYFCKLQVCDKENLSNCFTSTKKMIKTGR